VGLDEIDSPLGRGVHDGLLDRMQSPLRER
jgi:hypothetical protein